MNQRELVSQFQKACTLATFLSTRENTCYAHRIGIKFETLAIFKYILPDEITFAYEDTSSDTVFGAAPDQVLVFKFNDKRQPSTMNQTEKIVKVINERVARFERGLQQYLSRGRSLNELGEFSKKFRPSEVDNFENDNSETLKNGNLTRTELVGDELFNEVCEQLTKIVSDVTEPAKPPKYGKIPTELEKFVPFNELWSHQAEGLSHLLASSENHLVISTPTASGKSLIFHTIVKYFLENDPDSTAMFIYPTKALAQDQLRSFDYDNAFTFDGDTDFSKRSSVKQNARILFINPDILHTTILPNWTEFERILSNLRCVVMDEIHYYGGIFGANVALILRRLRRVCAQLGADNIQFIGCSATINDPITLMSTLTGVRQERIMGLNNENDGSPNGPKRFIFSTTSFVTPDDPGSGRMHPMTDAAPLLVRMIEHNMRVIAFCRYRKDCELLLRSIYEIDPGLKDVVKGYRGGYNADDRRQIESLMFNDQLQGIVATTALEVGIDIGSLDAAIIVGFPHSVSSFRQQVGRVGRRQKESLVVYIADGTVVDQEYCSNPDKVLKEPITQQPIIFHESLVRSHLQAAAYELALCESDGDFEFFPKVENFDMTHLEKLENGCFGYGQKPIINIRKSDNDPDTLVIDSATNRIIEKVELDRVSFTLYEGAIFIHQGKSYLVIYLEPDLRYAKVQRTHVKWVTRQRDFTDVDPLACSTSKYINEGYDQKNTIAAIGTGKIKVTTTVFGYFKFDSLNRIIDAVDVYMPPAISYKNGIWINLPPIILDVLKSRKHHIAAAIHAAEHALMSAMPIYIPMAPGDIGTECKAPEKELIAKRQTSRIRPARLIFFEKYGGSIGHGILKCAYARIYDIVKKASEAIDNCPCELGCAACVGAEFCVEQNIVLSKNGARVVFRMLLGDKYDDIPEGPDPNLPIASSEGIDTIAPVGSYAVSAEELAIEGNSAAEAVHSIQPTGNPEVKTEEIKTEEIKTEEIKTEEIKTEEMNQENEDHRSMI